MAREPLGQHHDLQLNKFRPLFDALAAPVITFEPERIIRELVGRAIPGWHSYSSWAYAPVPLTAEYLLDEKLRIHPSKRKPETGLSALQGVVQMRAQLREERHIVRLVGLSGVGKTRLMQAFFDERVGERIPVDFAQLSRPTQEFCPDRDGGEQNRG